MIQCKNCDKEFKVRKRSNDSNLFCSRDCAFAYKKAQPTARTCSVHFYECGHCKAVFTSRHASLTVIACSHKCAYRIRTKRQPALCAVCGDTFNRITQGRAVFCSLECKAERIKQRTKVYRKAYRLTDAGRDRRNEEKRLRKTRSKGAFVERVVRKQIYERDGWRCGLCHRKVNPNLAVPHPHAKTIDHIVPLSKGGTHEPRNVQLAHFICNSSRRANGDAQLRLM